MQGNIKDENTTQSLEDASIALYKVADSVLAAGTVTKSGGIFEIRKVKPGSYYLVVRFVGYKNKIISNIDLSNEQKKDLGTILLYPFRDFINSVTVSAQSANALNKIDKQVYKANQFQSAKGGTAIDVLKNMPSIAVNGEGNITLRGSSGFLVLLNGKPVQADIEIVLNQLPANAIEKIELITTPSAKYDPDGKAGIINITTKKGMGDGLSLIVNTQGGLPAIHTYGNKNKPVRFGGDATMNYKKNKWEISAGINYLRNDVAGYREGDVNTTINNIRTSFPSNGERSFKRYNYSLRSSVTYTANNQNIFSAGVYYGRRFQERTADILYNNSKTDLTTSEVFDQSAYFNANLQTKEGNFSLGNFDYTHNFKNKSSLNVSLLYEYADLYGNVKNVNFNDAKTTDTLQYTYNTSTNPLHGYRASLNYIIKTKTGQLESGYQCRYDKQDGDFIYNTQIPGTDEFVIDPAFTSGVYTRNHIHAVYSQYSGKQNKIEYNAGLRYEYATRNLSFSKDPEVKKLNLSNLFPSASLLYNFADKWKLKTAYSRRVQRSRNNELNPYPEREHSETLEQGDPNLLPEFVHLAELGIIKEYKTGSLFVTAYYQQIKNPVNRVNSVFNDTILNRLYTNAGKARLWGMETGITIKPSKKLQLYVGANLYNYKITGSLFGGSVPVNNSKWTYSINSNASLHVTSTITTQFNINYISEKATAQGEDSYFISPNSSVKKTFAKGKFSAMLQWQNMDLGLLNTNRQRITTHGINFYSTTNYILETDVLMLNLSFNLNAVNKKSKLPSSEFGEKEF
ncbi:MAG TPA: TonB-dependent receptor [Panacibacter sp.]|nr:TonB-dependent receptor [Panacibacter sp.]